MDQELALYKHFQAELAKDPELASLIEMIKPYLAMMAGEPGAGERELVSLMRRTAAAFHQAQLRLVEELESTKGVMQ